MITIRIFIFSIIFSLSNLFCTESDVPFIPTQQNCGAAITRNQPLMIDTVERAIACIQAGYKHIYWGDQEEIDQKFPHLSNKDIKFLNVPNKQRIIYTQKGCLSAHLLADYLTEYFKTIQRLKKFKDPTLAQKQQLEHLDSFNGRNHYLIGQLLQYNEDDIKYFYERNKIKTFDKDKKTACQWIKQRKLKLIKKLEKKLR